MTAVSDSTIRLWHFQCPDCGMSDQEFGHLAESDDIHCAVCLQDQRRTVILRRWPADDSVPAERRPLCGSAIIPPEPDRLASQA
jgi:hypothetical protein